MMSYECILTALPTISKNNPLPISLEALNDFLTENLSKDDIKQLELLKLTYENDIFKNQIEILADNIAIQPSWWDELSHSLSTQDLLVHVLYEIEQGKLKCKQNIFAKDEIKKLASPCLFIKQWFELNQNINNILVATICIRHKLSVANSIIGTNDIANSIRNSSNIKDFGLRGIVDIIDDILNIATIENLYDREKAIDDLRFDWLEEQTLFNYFSLSNILAYYLKVTILHRWSLLSVEKGEQIFKNIVSDMKSGINLNV